MHCASVMTQSIPLVAPMKLDLRYTWTWDLSPANPPQMFMGHKWEISLWHLSLQISYHLNRANTKDETSKPHCFIVIFNCSKSRIILYFTSLGLNIYYKPFLLSSWAHDRTTFPESFASGPIHMTGPFSLDLEWKCEPILRLRLTTVGTCNFVPNAVLGITCLFLQGNRIIYLTQVNPL
jgi:hypothetical protein